MSPGYTSDVRLQGLYLSLLSELASLHEEREEFELPIKALGRVVAKSLRTRG